MAARSDQDMVTGDHTYASQEDMEESTSRVLPVPQRQPYGGSYCCVVGCHNNTYRDIPRLKFHVFPRDQERRQLWVKAVNREVPGRPGVLWQPKNHDVVCSEHFVGGLKSNDKTSPAYAPTLFPTHEVQRKQADLDREMRLNFRSAAKARRACHHQGASSTTGMKQ